MADLDSKKVLSHNHAMAVWVNQMLRSRWKCCSITSIDGSMIRSMATVLLPPPLEAITDAEISALQSRMHDRYKIEVPIFRWMGKVYARPCCQIYNSPQDYHRLAEAIETEIS